MLAALNAPFASTVNIIAGLGWDPEIRGLLTVVLGMAVLGGSVWLLLVTNTGTRLGSLIALAGFWGWMFIMGIFWWIYGIGWVGSSPTWQVQDVFSDPAGAEEAGISEAFIGNVGDLPDANCFPGTDSFPPEGGVATATLSRDLSSLCTPRAVDLLMAYPEPRRELLLQELLNPQNDEAKIRTIAPLVRPGVEAGGASEAEMLELLSAAERNQVFDALVQARHGEIAAGMVQANEALGVEDPRGADLGARIDEAIDRVDLKIDELSLSQLKATGPEVTEWATAIGALELHGWSLQSPSQSGEAAATADTFLRQDMFPDGHFVVLDAYQQGGKPKRTSSGLLARIGHKITSTARLTHPTNYTVINVQKTKTKKLDPAKPPPIDEADPDEPTLSVVLVRDLGNKRVIPALFTLTSLVLFGLCALVLHWRDLAMREKGIEV